MPDALSKTVPIWCAVLNSLLLGNNKVFLPEEVVGPSETAQIQQRVDGWTRDAEVYPTTIENHSRSSPY